MWFDMVKGFYKDKLYSNDDVKVFVVANMIDEVEYKQITSEDYIV